MVESKWKKYSSADNAFIDLSDTESLTMKCCGGPQSGDGGDLMAADTIADTSCLWSLTADSGKQIVVEISVCMYFLYHKIPMSCPMMHLILQEIEFKSESCVDNYLEIVRGNQENGKVVKKFCPGDTATSVSTNSNGVYVKWVKKKGTTSSFSGKWTATTASCCNKVAVETPFASRNGIYNFDEATGHYKQDSGENILFQNLNFNSYFGWFIGPHENSAGVLNPVLSTKLFYCSLCFSKTINNLCQDYTTCPEMVEAKWQQYTSSDGYVDFTEPAAARCSDCTKNPAEPECCKYYIN